MEPECSIAVPTSDNRMEVYVGSQIPYQDRSQVARVLGWDNNRVRILGQKMGGGFGGKEGIYRSDPCRYWQMPLAPREIAL